MNKKKLSIQLIYFNRPRVRYSMYSITLTLFYNTLELIRVLTNTAHKTIKISDFRGLFFVPDRRRLKLKVEPYIFFPAVLVLSSSLYLIQQYFAAGRRDELQNTTPTKPSGP